MPEDISPGTSKSHKLLKQLEERQANKFALNRHSSCGLFVPPKRHGRKGEGTGKRGTMMRQIQDKNKRYGLRVAAACAGLVFFAAGCGARDAAIVISAKEAPVAAQAGMESGEPAAGGTVGKGGTESAGESGSAGKGASESAGGSGTVGRGASESAGGSGLMGRDAAGEDGVRIYVYVCGAVMEPGVVELAEGSRAEDALRAAGGFAEDAQTDYVNLAAKVSDGEKLYFPNTDQARTMAEEERAEALGLVNINTADAATLCTLPGIGGARAQDIISYREEHGAFQSKEDIMKVPGIKTAAYGKLQDKITVE